MKAQTSTLLALLLAGAAIASPTPRPAQRLQKLQQRKPLNIKRSGRNIARQTSAQTSDNWGGIVTSGSSVTAVEANFTVPDVQLASGDSPSDQWTGSAWVGIDGTGSCGENTGLWQSGVAWQYDDGQGWTYYAWYEWFPADPVPIDIDVQPGDNVYVQVDATSSTTGDYWFINNSNGQQTQGTASSEYPLCFENAEWIVENNSGPDGNGEGTEMPDFGSVQFTDAAYEDGSTVYGIESGYESIVDDDSTYYTDCTVSGDQTINCQWIDTSS